WSNGGARVGGLRGRDIYGGRAAEILRPAPRELGRLVFTGRQNALKPVLELTWAELVYEGMWYEPLLADLNVMFEGMSRQVEGEVTLRLYKGTASVVSRRSPWALYDKALATFDADPTFSQNASPGFIELFSLQSRMAHRIARAREDRR